MHEGLAAETSEDRSLKTKAYILTTLLVVILFLDVLTKRWAEETLNPLAGGEPTSILGGLIPLTHAYNRGAAFGISIGNDPRWFFIPVTLGAMVLLGVLLVKAAGSDRFRIFALSLVFSGALGNLIDRVRWERGVVDFIGPINLGFMHWPIFNIADMAISCGAIALAISFWMEEMDAEGSPGKLAVEADKVSGG
jgi:signal peptidase II